MKMSRAELFCVFLVAAAAQLLELSTLARGALQYHSISSDPKALCNDFTQAGYFLFRQQQNPEPKTPEKWIVFLESGGFCYSPESCNERFFHPEVRKEEKILRSKDKGKNSHGSFDSFDPAAAWERNRDRDLSEVVSPLMTSMSRFRNSRSAFSGGTLTIEGRDIMDGRCERNPTFCNHNKVVIPYCSSDLWLGNDTRTLMTAGK